MDKAPAILKAMLTGWEFHSGGLHLAILDGRLVEIRKTFQEECPLDHLMAHLDLNLFLALCENVSPEIWTDANEWIGMRERAGR
jgi:hypothetical protein